jgi:3-hydroxybutyryl-CoA dehydrogenase
MGNGIAHTFAQSGFTVKLIDVSEQSLDKEWLLLRKFRSNDHWGTITEEDKAKTITNIITYTDIKDGV